jgi:hypothetical protein
MNNRQRDRQQLNDLVNGWTIATSVNGPRYVSCFILMARSKLRGLKELAAILCDGSMRMGASAYAPNTSSAHRDHLQCQREQGYSETNAMIIMKTSNSIWAVNAITGSIWQKKETACEIVYTGRAFTIWVPLPSRSVRLKLTRR